MSNVVLIEPNDVNINTNIVNGIPQYQDMYIFAELKAVRKGRTVLVTTGNNKYSVEPTGFENTTKINLLGINQTEKNPNFLNFTTNYYDGSSGSEVQYEGFGMTSIQVTINSSFIPQVNVQFVDVRGLAFFNREDSPYRILFDFPPPIFELTIKGYYGKPLTYELHLVKYTTEFKAENGNFVIDAQFVAITFAPLSDVLFRYVVNFPFMLENISASPETKQPPRNTYELIIKLRNLYSAVSEDLKTDTESKQYDTILHQISQNNDAFAVLGEYNSELNEKGIPYVFTKEKPEVIIPFTASSKDDIQPLDNIFDYDAVVRELADNGFPTTIDKRIYIAYIAGANVSPVLSPDSGKINILKTQLETFRAKILKSVREAQVSLIINDTDVSKPEIFDNAFDIGAGRTNNSTTTKYVGIDVTNLYVKLYKQRFELEKSRADIVDVINEKINNKVLDILGMNPTIYNIFKIILDDVDRFFEILRTTSYKAENDHHVKYKKSIFGNNSYEDIKTIDKIFAFPLIVNKQGEICGGFREERIAPIDLSNRLPEPFPEIDLVNNFITTFQTQERIGELLTMKSEQDADGTYKWIPISPFDSILGSSDIVSPYYGVDTTSGEPINIDNDPRITQILKTVLKRFYILTQSSLPESFYLNNNKASNAYIDLYAQSEAVNLAASVTQSNYGNLLKDFAGRYNTNNTINNFYTYLDNNVKDYYDFTEENRLYFPISPTENAYVNKENDDYVGVRIYSDAIDIQVFEEQSDKPVSKFQKNVQRGLFGKIFAGRLPESFYLFTQENVIYIKDDFVKDNVIKEQKTEKYNGISLETRYLTKSKKISDLYISNASKPTIIDNFLSNGNSYFGNIAYTDSNAPQLLRDFDNIVEIWIDQMADHDDEIFGAISGISQLSAVILLSNFGLTLSPFNIFPRKLNELIFTNPAAIEVPTYLPYYIGSLVYANESGLTDELKDFFTTGAGKNLESDGFFIFADIADVENFLSEEDKKTFKAHFDAFYNTEFQSILTQFYNLYQKAKELVANGKRKTRAYRELLDPDKTGEDNTSFYTPLIEPLIERITIIVFSQLTFKNPQSISVGYKSLKTLNEESPAIKNINDAYFKKFFTKLKDEIVAKEKQIEEEEEEQKKLKGDKDVVTQTYYSFKNINDKWLSNPTYPNVYGYPFNGNKPSLISSFAFVDRAMNPIGDTMINPEVLLTLFEDYNATIFTVLSQLLSTNGFEFFPLQNFLAYDSGQWEDSFRIDTGPIVGQQAAFVCMYIGGTSSYPTGVQNGFVEDGITDLGSTNATDFSTSNCPSRDFGNDNQTRVNPKFPWREVRAFKVRFGEQNQSMFTDVKIDSKEYPETNESIQILSRIAGDNKLQAPIPKGQNLYNLYENRAYQATITGLGNAMIQPTQYFQLENVPIFNGAYIILNVEHNLVPNKMTTSFSGVKILRYPVPRITNPAAVFGFDGGSSENTMRNSSTGEIIRQSQQAIIMSQQRLDELDSVFGVDVSRWQTKVDWNKLANNPNSNEPSVKFAFIKLSQDNFNDKKAVSHATGAKNAGLKIAYYHYAQQYNGDDIVGNATAQANFFVNSIDKLNLPEPDFPLVLDIEDNEPKGDLWGVVKSKNDLWINTFISVLKDKGYDTILYGNRNFFDTKTSGNFGNIPLWHAQYPKEPEMTNPTVAKAWQKNGQQNWTVWQFSSQGRLYGYNGDIDINAMKKKYFNKA